jgi:hypothetical protein
MGERSDQIERHIQETRNDLSDNFNELQERARTAVDWRAQFEERPATMLALAFGGGMLLSALLPSRRSSRRRASDRYPNSFSDRYMSDLQFKPRYQHSDNASSPLETLDAVKGALVGLATTKLSGFIKNVLPGLTQEFFKAQEGRNSDRSDTPKSGQPTGQKSSAAAAG